MLPSVLSAAGAHAAHAMATAIANMLMTFFINPPWIFDERFNLASCFRSIAKRRPGRFARKYVIGGEKGAEKLAPAEFSAGEKLAVSQVDSGCITKDI